MLVNLESRIRFEVRYRGGQETFAWFVSRSDVEDFRARIEEQEGISLDIVDFRTKQVVS